jgi:hypothetical protein
VLKQPARDLLIAGVTSGPAAPADKEYFASLRTRVRAHQTTRAKAKEIGGRQ